MAQYHNQQYPPYDQYSAPQPPPPPPPPRPDREPGYQHQYSSPASYPVNGVPYLEQGYPAPSAPSSARPQDELFFGAPPVPDRYHASAGHTPQSPEQQSPYNPGDYAAQITPSTPQSAGSLTGPRLSLSTHQPYVPADYAAHQQQQQQASSQYYTPALPSPPTPQGIQRQSSLYTASRPTIQTGGYSSHYASAGPPPLPSIPSATEPPSSDFGAFPGITRYTSTRYGRNANAQSPPAPSPSSHHRRTSSSGPLEYNYTPSNQTPSPGAPPPPPPHGSYGRSSVADLHHRPLPSLPSHESPAQPDYFAYEEKQVQANLENQILSSVGATPSPQGQVNGSAPSSDEDNFALGGLQALEEAERQDREDAQRRASLQSGLLPVPSNPLQYPQHYAEASSSDGPGVDLASFGGGFPAPLTSHVVSPNQLAVNRTESVSGLHGRQGSQTMSSSGSRRSRNTSDNNSHQYAPQVDIFDTGGLVDSTRPRRLSYDEGAEEELEAATGYEFFHPGIGNRPLPPPPARQTRSQNEVPMSVVDWTGDTVPFPRNHSMVQHSATPLPYAPARSATDADEKRRKPQRRSMIGIDSGEESASAAMMLDLPNVTKRFNPSKLSSRDFNRCTEPWALSAITTWLRRLVADEQYLKKQPLIEALVALFTHKVTNMNIADAETLAGGIIDEMHSNGTLYDEEEWLFFSETPLVGVIFQLTGSGCYSSKLHDYETPGRCYAHHCQRTEKKIDLSSETDPAAKASWVEFYNISIEDVAKYDKKEVERQNILHEIVQTEENYVRNLGVLQTLYRDELSRANPPLIPPKTLPSFLNDVFGKLDAVKKSNEEYLLPQIKYRQKEQGPWIVGFSDIFRDWIRKARVAYIDYASSYPNAISKVRQEMERNMLFKTFLDKCLQDERAGRLDYNHYMKVPIGRLQSVVLLLETALRKSILDTEEKRTLQSAIEEIRKVTYECDTRVGDGTRKVELSNLQSRFQFRGTLPRVDLNLDHLGRELIHQGELVRASGTTRLSSLIESHCFLFDHFFVLAKQENIKSSDGVVKSDQYDITRMPIPMDLLVLESRDDELVVRAAIAGVTKVTPAAGDRIVKAPKDSNQPGLQHSTTSTSLQSLASLKSVPPIVTNVEAPKDDKTMYPFKIRHLGRETYTLYAQSAQSREDWCNKIIEAKTKHAHALFAQNAEPFKLKVIADTAFAYDGATSAQAGIAIKGTPLDRAVQEVAALYANYGRPAPVCRARVNCATSFQVGSKEMVAVGTDYGVYVAQTGDPRGWQKVIPNPKVTQIAVIEDFQLFILISDKSLMGYHLDAVCPPNGVTPSNDSARAAPHKISGNKDVGFFSIARMKDRTLLFYKKGSVSSTFKVLEPVLVRSTERRSRFPPMRSGRTDFFRDFDEFYIPTECSAINLFRNSIAVSSSRGIEILQLDRKQPVSIPTNLAAPSVATIAQRLAGQKPLGMFRLSDQEFLLVFEVNGVYVDKTGDINRSAILEFVGRARAAAMYGAYILLFDADFVEIRNAMNGRLRQVIAGRDVRMLDDASAGGASGTRRVKVAMQHPEVEKSQIVVELALNEGLRE